MNQKERLEEIKKKHERERYKRKISFHRAIVSVVLLVFVALITFGIKSCANYRAEKQELKRQEEIAKTEVSPTSTPEISSAEYLTEINKDFYANSAFVGNSFAEGLMTYDILDDVDYFSRIGLNVNDAMSKSTTTGNIPVIDELGQGKQYNKIFFIFGENELGWVNSDIFISEYRELIDKAKSYQPNAQIYLFAITPVTQKASDENLDNANNPLIVSFNEQIKQLATDKGVNYADAYTAVADENGALPADAASDGIHFGIDYYEKCLIYIQSH